MKKKLLSVFLAVTLVFGACPLSAFAAEPEQSGTESIDTNTPESTDSAPEESTPSPDTYVMYRAPEIILSEDYAFTENEIAEVRNGNSTDERVGYAHNQAEFKTLVATPSIKIIVIAARTIEVNENLIVDRSITFLSFSAEPVTLRSSSELERDSYFIQVSEQDGSPILDRDINLRFSNVIIECKHAGSCMNIKAADGVADHQADYAVRIEGACIRFNLTAETGRGATTASVSGVGNIDLIGCMVSCLDHTSCGAINLTIKTDGTSTIRDCTLIDLMPYGYAIGVNGPYSGKAHKMSIINCKSYNSVAFLNISGVRELEVTDCVASDFVAEGVWVSGIEIAKIKNLQLLHPSKDSGGIQLAGHADTFIVDHLVIEDAPFEVDLYGETGTISNTDFIVDRENAENNAPPRISAENLTLDNVKISGYETGFAHGSGGLTLKNCEISGCKTGISVSGADLTLENTKVINNSEVGIKGTCSNLSIMNSEISGNGYAKTEKSRGGICVGGTNLEEVSIASSTIADNYSAGSGGGLCIEDSEAEVAPTVSISSGTEFTGNSAAQNGGAISLSDPTKLTTDETTKFSFNMASNAYLPPANAAEAYPNMEFSSTSVTEHLLNNYDVSFVGETPATVISSIEPLEGITVDLGTLPIEVQTLLATKYPQATGILSDGSKWRTPIPVSWDVENSEYDGEKIGNYTIYGNLILEGEAFSDVSVLNGAKAEINVTVDDRNFEIISVDDAVMTVEQNIYLKPLNKNYELAGSPDLASPPDKVTVHLYSGKAEQLEVAWHTEDFKLIKEEQEIIGDIVIPKDMRIKNTAGHKAKLKVAVTPMTYKVAKASPKEIFVEAYRGTTLEELNQQLAAEGKDEISVLATNSQNSGKRTFARISLQEGVNPDWDNQKDICGTYALTASLPENMTPRTNKAPGPIHVNVTVLEPLEITETKLAQGTMYQGVEPANAVNILPQKVTAVLEDNSEIEVGVEWDWSFYNKNSLTNPPILGHLVDLPRKAKQPVGEETTANLTVQMVSVTYVISDITGVSEMTAKAGLTLEEITALSGQDDSDIPAFSRTLKLSGEAEDGKEFNIDYVVPFTLTSEANPTYSSTTIGEHTLTVTLALPDFISTESFPAYNQINLTTQPVAITTLETKTIIDREGTPFAELSNVPEQVLATLDVIGPDGNAKTALLSVDWGEGAGYTPLPEGLTETTSVTMTVNGTLADLPAYLLPTDLVPTLSVTLGREFDILSITLAQSDELEVKLGTDYAAMDGMVDHEAILELRCTNGELQSQVVSFELREEDNPQYNPSEVGTYHLIGRLLAGSNVKNPNNIPVKVTVRTAKYNIIEFYVPEEDIYMFAGEDPLLYLPETMPTLLSNDEIEEVDVTWDMDTIDAEVSDFYVVEGIFNLPIYLENPNNIQPFIFVFVDEPESQIISMKQLVESKDIVSDEPAYRETSIPGYTAHRYSVNRLYKDGSIKQQTMTCYHKAK